MNDQISRANAFKALHARPGIFAIPNPWDAGSAKMLATLGFEALATTSAGFAFTLARPDGGVGRDATLANVRAIVGATSLPVAADLENGFGDAPATCAETIRLGAAAGLVGGSIEDATGNPGDPIYPLDASVARVAAAVAAARSLPFPFTLTARAENFLHGRPDLDDTIARLKAFAAAGADVLYTPGIKTRDAIDAVVRAVAPKPVNVIMGLAGVAFSLEQLAELGVKRVSVGSSLSRVALAAFWNAAKEIAETGTFAYGNAAMASAELNAMFRGGDRS